MNRAQPFGRAERVSRCAAAVLAGLATAAAWTGGPNLAAAQEQKLPKAEEILDKSVDALGGKAAFEKLRNRVTKARIETQIPGRPQSQSAALTMYQEAPNKCYEVVELEGIGKVETATDGVTYWENSPVQGARVLEGEEKAQQQRATLFNPELRWRELYQKVECVAVEDVAGVPCYKLVLTPAEGKPETVWYDRKTYLPAKGEAVLATSMGALPVQQTFADYRKVDGILVRHKLTQTTAGVEQVITVESIRHNVDIPPDRFALPEAITKLVDKPKGATQPATRATEKREKGG